MPRPHPQALPATAPLLFDKLSRGHGHTPHLSIRRAILRDVEALLNACAHNKPSHAERQPYGLPAWVPQGDLHEQATQGAQHIERTLRAFEARLVPHTIRVSPVLHDTHRHLLAVVYHLFCVSRLPEMREPLQLRVAFDYACGAARVVEA